MSLKPPLFLQRYRPLPLQQSPPLAGHQMKHIQLSVLLLGLVISNAAFALRCGHSVIDLGNRKNEVYDKCGEPASIETRKKLVGRTIQNSNRTLGLQEYEEIEIEEWIYDFGPRRLKQYLRFENGRLREIKNLGRGD